MKAAFVIAIAAVLTAAPAAAWGDRGHRAIADIAWTQMTPAARHGVAELLAAAPALATPACPVGSLEDGASWADCVRSKYHERFADTASWHYINVSVCEPFRLPDDPDARFIVARFEREVAILGDRSNPPLARLEALLWVAHLAGDLHQPLHVGDASDRGGNEAMVYPQIGRYPHNLHSEWDHNLVDDAIEATPGGVAGLSVSAGEQDNKRRWQTQSPAAWARESWELAQRVAYPTRAHASLCGGDHPAIDIDDGYQSSAIPVVKIQLERAGVRLADVLNTALK